MEDRETARMRKYGESKTTRIMMATVPHVTSGLGLRKFQADGFLLTRVYVWTGRAAACLLLHTFVVLFLVVCDVNRFQSQSDIFLLSCLPILSWSSFVSWCDVIRKLISRTQHRHCKWVASNKTPLAVCLFWACIWSLCRYSSTSWGRQAAEIYWLHCRFYLAQVPWHIGLPDFSLFETRMTVQ